MSKTYDVVISGGGAVGPACAIELALRGVDVLVVEQTERGAYKAPRTNLTNIRSMEHFRRWGIAESHREAVPLDPEFPADFAFVTRLNGYEIVRFENVVMSHGRNEMFAENAVWAEQGTIERSLRDRVEAAPSAEYRWGTRVVGFTQTDENVRVMLEHVATGERDEIECQYLAGCDGSRGVVRRELGIRMEGKPNLNVNSGMSIYAPALKSLCHVGLAVMYWFVNDDVGGWLGPLDDQGNWFFHVLDSFPEAGDPDSFDDMRRLLYMCVGEEFPVEYVSGGKWVTHSLLAPTMQQGRVFIAGDAAHLIPPTGGFGMNISILDGVDLGWKLAARLGGWGGPRLLDSYTVERHAADRWVIDAQEENNRIKSEELHQEGMEEPGEAGESVRESVRHMIVTEKAQEFASLGCQLGYRYENSPIIAYDDSPWPEVSQPVYVPSAHPGCLAPHKWLADGRSLYDLFGPEFTLLKVGANGGVEAERVVNAARDRGLPLDFIEVNEPGMRELYEADLALIRPDQHVAWRGDAAPEDPAALVDQVRGA